MKRMQLLPIISSAVLTALVFVNVTSAAETSSVLPDLGGIEKPFLWSAECVQPEGSGLAFGGCDRAADDGCARTRIKEGSAWKPIFEELRAQNSLQKSFMRAWELRTRLKNATSRARFVFFTGLAAAEEQKLLNAEAVPALTSFSKDLDTLAAELSGMKLEKYEAGQIAFALPLLRSAAAKAKPAADALKGGVSAEQLKMLREAQVELERAAESLDAEPPARSLSPIVYDEKNKLYVIFGGDHHDYLTNDTWVFDPAKKKWMQKQQAGAPAPRANHQLKAADGKIMLSGGYTYTSTTDYMSPHYRDVKDGDWTYDAAANAWVGAGKLEPAGARVYRKDPYLPEFFMQGEKPNAAAFENVLKAMPANTWVMPKPRFVPRQNRDWGTVIIDTDQDMLLYWSGGHCAHGGSDVLHYHLGTNRWELSYPVELPLGQTYTNTQYPDTFNFNRRPWISGHTYQSYVYDPTSKKMLFNGHTKYCYIYDPEIADWTGRIVKPQAMSYWGCFYDLTCAATGHGAVCWNKEGVFHFDAAKTQWDALKFSGKLPGTSVDSSTLAYDSKRDRLLMFSTGYKEKFSGQVYSLDLKTPAASALSPSNMAAVPAVPFEYFRINRACYDPENDLVVMGTLLPPGEDGLQRIPAYDCASNRWVGLKLKYELVKDGNEKYPCTPHGVSGGMAFDPKRKLFWGVDTNCGVYVLKLDAKTADPVELKQPVSVK